MNGIQPDALTNQRFIDALDAYSRRLALTLRRPDLKPAEAERLERLAIATAAMTSENRQFLAAAALWNILGWRIIAAPVEFPTKVAQALGYFQEAGSLTQSETGSMADSTFASARLGEAVAYTRLPLDDPTAVRGQVIASIRAATQRLPKGPNDDALRLDLLSVWGDLMTNAVFASEVHRRDARRARSLAEELLARAARAEPRLYLAAFALGVALTRLGDPTAGVARLRNARRLASAAGDLRYVGRAFTQAANATRAHSGKSGSLEAARLQERAGEAFHAASLPVEEADAFRTAGVLFLEQRQWRSGEAAFRRSIAASEQAVMLAALDQDVRQRTGSLASAEHALALCLVRIGRPADAAVAADRARARRLRSIPRMADPGFAHVRTYAPLLADAYLAVQHRIRQAEIQEQAERAQPSPDAPEHLAMVASDLLLARSDREVVLAKMRAVPGAREKLAPLNLKGIRSRLSFGSAVVYLVPSPYGGVAVVVTMDEVAAIDLPRLTNRAVSRRLQLVTEAYDMTRDHPDDGARRAAWNQEIDRAGAWLWRTCMGPVLAACGKVGRIVLIAGGGLDFLPLHAAWRVDGSGRREYAIDRLAISYSPCADLQPKPGPSTDFGNRTLLMIADPAPTSAALLPGALAEAGAIGQGFANVRVLDGAAATAPTILSVIQEADVVHAACHGRTEFGKPYSSYLLMACDAQLTVSDVVDLTLDRRPSVFLSACETNLHDFELADEVQSLSAAFLAAGAQDVVSTLWTIGDQSALSLAVMVYDQRLRGSPGVEALRHAQRWLRDTPNRAKADVVADMRWIPDDVRSALAHSLSVSTEDHSRPEHWAAHVYSGG
jgi:hypothetical protein